MANKTDIYTRVTDRIITQLEQGVRPWVQPWKEGPGRVNLRPLRHSGVAYRGINVLLLWMEAFEKGYVSPYWLTFRQALELKGHVRKGETGTMVVYSNQYTKTVLDDAGEEVEQARSVLKSYTVFNAEQIDDLPASYYPAIIVPDSSIERIAAADRFFANTGLRIVTGGNSAYYVPAFDRIHMPPIDLFADAASYYATLAHESTHATMHMSRLNRTFESSRWGDEGYAMEELVAELGAAFLSADLNLDTAPREDHAAYLGHWLKVLKTDRHAIFAAASHAQRACDFLHGLQPQNPE